ncbi:MAG: flavoprotein [Candidatus Omnitrophota bacterium]
MKKREIVLGVTGSIAIYKACDLIRLLKAKDYNVSVVMTKEAEAFISPMLFQSLSGNKVYTGLFDLPETWSVEHVGLAEKADLVLVAPATANIIAKLTYGICDDLLSCVVLATKAKVLIAPAMNENMYLNKITQENIKKLKVRNFKFIEPHTGKLACDKIGVGCLAEVEKIVKEISSILR